MNALVWLAVIVNIAGAAFIWWPIINPKRWERMRCKAKVTPVSDALTADLVREIQRRYDVTLVVAMRNTPNGDCIGGVVVSSGGSVAAIADMIGASQAGTLGDDCTIRKISLDDM